MVFSSLQYCSGEERCSLCDYGSVQLDLICASASLAERYSARNYWWWYAFIVFIFTVHLKFCLLFPFRWFLVILLTHLTLLAKKFPNLFLCIFISPLNLFFFFLFKSNVSWLFSSCLLLGRLTTVVNTLKKPTALITRGCATVARKPKGQYCTPCK